MNFTRFFVSVILAHGFLTLGACATTTLERTPQHASCVGGDLAACVAWGDSQLADTGANSLGRRDALTAYTFACTNNHAPACTRLAELYGERQDDPRQIRETLRKACEGGEQSACVEFAGKLSRRQAMPYYQAACDAGVGAGCTALASAYGDAGLLGDYLGKSVTLFEQGCALKHQPACVGAGRAYLFGTGVTTDTQKGLGFLESTCTADEGSGCVLMARIFEEGIGVPVDVKRSNAYYQTAAQHAQVEEVSTPASAFVIYVDGCNNGDALGCFNAAVMLAEGIDVDRNVSTARDLFLQACEEGCDLACERQKRIRNRKSGKDSQ